MKRESLSAEKRTITGKQVRKLRREGILPANLFGKGLKSMSLQLPLKSFQEVYKKVHETGLVDLEVEKDVHPILIQNVQVHPITHEPIHADFFKVNLKEKVHASIPIVAVGEPKAVTDKIGVLLQPLSEIEVEALPADLPEHIEVNVEKLAQIDESIAVSELKVPSGVELHAEPTEMVFRIGELVSEEAEELAEEEAAEAEAASEATEGETPAESSEGETPAEGEASETPAE
jgi:large subunit ribosomal protein L25